MKLIIEDDEGRKTIVPFVREEISIGRQEGNTIRLTERNVSRKHAKLVRSNGSVLIEDLGSFNGVKVNGDKIEGKLAVEEGDLIEIGDYDLAIESEETDPPKAKREERDDGRAKTVPSGGPVSGRATTEPGGFRDGGPNDPDGPPRSQATAVIQREASSVPAGPVRDLAPSERPKLVILSGPQSGDEHVIEQSELRIGRTGEDNDLAIDHRSISRNHAKLVLDADGGWRVLDLQSANGLRVNGEDYADAPLATGDELELGHVKLRFIGPGEDDKTPLPRGAKGESTGSGMSPMVWVGGLVVLAALAGGGWFYMNLNKPPAIEPRPPMHLADNNPPPTQPAAPAMPTPPTPPPAPVQKVATPEPKEPREPKEPAEPAEAQEPAAEKPARPVHHPAVEHRAPHKAAEPAPEATPEGENSGDEAAAKPEKPEKNERAEKKARAGESYQEALSLMTAGDLRAAVGKLLHAVTLDPGHADAHKALGICYAKLGQADKGAVHYEQYLKLKPDASDAEQVRSMLQDYYKSQGQ
jgi:pSer/pThr/pTyr-binding forkhead associated (FHA) protein